MIKDKDQSAFTTPSNGTRGNAREIKRSKKHIAYHHFHPAIIQEVVINQGFTTIDALPKNLLEDFNLLGNGYTEADRFKDPFGRMEGHISMILYQVTRMLNVTISLSLEGIDLTISLTNVLRSSEVNHF